MKTRESYLHYSPAVRLGNSLASSEVHRGNSWAEIEPEARRQWEEEHDRPWEEFRAVVRQAWDEVRRQFSEELESVEDPTSYEAIFRRHYEANYAHSQYDYSQFAIAYEYGYDLAVDKRLRDKSWAEIEPEARRYWNDQSYAGFWDEFKEAVYYAWSTVRERYDK